MEHATDFYDRAKKRIYIGDISEHRLNGKNANAHRYRVIKVGAKLFCEDVVEHGYAVKLDLNEQFASRSVIVDREIFR